MKLDGLLRLFTDFGYYGVYLFFIISGFLIANSIENYGNTDWIQFVAKRIIKLLPLYYAVILYYFLVHTFVFCDVPDDPTRFGWIRYLFLLVGTVPNTDIYFWDNLGITWTIPCFFWMYLLLPAVLKRINNFWGIVLLYIVSLMITAQVWNFGGWLTNLYYVPFFIQGLILYYCFKEHKQSIVGFCAGISILADMIKGTTDVYTYTYVFILMFLSVEKMQIEPPMLQRILALLDKYSYTLYLAHGIIFIHILDRYDMRRSIEAVIAILGSIVLTLLLYHLVERPLQMGLRKLIENGK